MQESETEQLAQLCFALEGRTEGTLVLIACDTQTTRLHIFNQLQTHFPSQPMYELDLSGVQVESLNRSLRQNLPEQILTATAPPYLVHVSGLEDSLFISEGGKIQVSTLVAQLNFERETLFRDFPFTTIIWTDPHFLDVLKRQAPDLWSWLVYVYEFASETPAVSEPVQPQAYPELVPGLTPERQLRIANLESKYAQLNLKEAKERVLREKLNLQKLLGREYAEVHDYEKSIKAYRTAQSLLEQLKDDGSELLETFFNLGTVYLQSHQYAEARQAYLASLDYQKKLNLSLNYAATHHQLGMVYQKQRKWNDAIQHYQLALEWNQKTHNNFEHGGTYHQLGTVYQEQRKWNDAIQHYQLALEWYKKTHNDFALGSTYHQLGGVYLDQRKWDEAIQYYQLALEWKQKTHNDFALGSTYHQLGIAYQKQQKWDDAIQNCQLALEWFKKTHNDFALGSTYHQLGRVYEEQQKWDEAIQNYQLALEWKQKTHNNFELGSTYHHLGIVYQKQQKWNDAIQNYQLALEWFKKTHNDFELYRTHFCLGEFFKELKQSIAAASHYQEALVYLQQYPPPNFDEIQALIHQQLKNIHSDAAEGQQL